MSPDLSAAAKLKRTTNFPLQVKGLYLCPRRNFPPSEHEIIYGKYEITIRLDSDTKLCLDEIDGVPMNIPFPNVVFKEPGMKIRLGNGLPREAAGFNYDTAGMELLKSWGMLPKEKFFPIHVTEKLERLLNEFRTLVRSFEVFSNPGDRIDTLCFEILRELLLNCRRSDNLPRPPEVRIAEAERYLREHCTGNLNLDEVAKLFDFSHAAFYRHWKKHRNSTPRRFVEELKLRRAAQSLLESERSIVSIISEVNFPGASAFHRKFKELFGTTPGEFRKRALSKDLI